MMVGEAVLDTTWVRDTNRIAGAVYPIWQPCFVRPEQ